MKNSRKFQKQNLSLLHTDYDAHSIYTVLVMTGNL